MTGTGHTPDLSDVGWSTRVSCVRTPRVCVPGDGTVCAPALFQGGPNFINSEYGKCRRSGTGNFSRYSADKLKTVAATIG